MVLLAALGACSQVSDQEEAGTSVLSTTRGYVGVTLQIEHIFGSREASITGSVRFLGIRGIDGDVAEVLADDRRIAILDIDHCELANQEAALDEALQALSDVARIAHLDAGEIRVQAADIAVGSALPRHIPALFPVVTGVEYAEIVLTDLLETGLPEAAEVSVTAFGGADIGPFDAVATAPPMPGQVEARFVGDDLQVAWAAEGSGDSRLLVSVAGPAGRPVLRCRVEDDGGVTVRRSVLEQLPTYESRDLIVSVERLHRVPLGATGIRDGVLEVSVRYVVTASTL